MSRTTLVAALARDRAIGRAGAIPWRLPDDMRGFRDLTTSGAVLMGRRTAESLGRALPGRRNLVLTRTGRVPHEGMQPVASLDAARAAAGDVELFVIGGEEVYAATLPDADRLVLTHVDTVVPDADTWFPGLPDGTWTPIARRAHPADDRHAVGFAVVEYVRDRAGHPG